MPTVSIGTRSSVLIAGAICVLLSQCTVVPTAEDRPVSTALSAPKSGTLVKTATRLASGRRTGDSSFLLLESNKEALDWRLALIDEAESSIDIQLYLWHSGFSGRLLFDRLLRAADRGVRVRVLVDDFLFSSDEKVIASICRYQPNLDIRIFNPTRLRGNPLGSTLEFFLNFRHLNRRMHNKTWTVDRTFTIVGGRNVGDHYFGLDEKYNFLDLDVMAAGPVVADVSEGFDLFWNSAQAYPGALLSPRAEPQFVADAKVEVARVVAEERDGMLRSFPVSPRSWSREFAALPGQMARGRGQFLQDHPVPEMDDRAVVTGLRDISRSNDGEVIMVTPYLIPSDGAIGRLSKSIADGLRIGILAPTLAANNQAAAHGHYHRKRRGIVESGSRLFEMRHDPSESLRNLVDVEPVRCREVALHAKALVGDGERCFIGSLNLDPRAMAINTESGMLIDSPQLSGELRKLLSDIVHGGDAWVVTLDPDGRIEWRLRDETRTSPPPARFSKRVMSRLVGWLPIENQL